MNMIASVSKLAAATAVPLPASIRPRWVITRFERCASGMFDCAAIAPDGNRYTFGTLANGEIAFVYASRDNVAAPVGWSYSERVQDWPMGLDDEARLALAHAA